MKRILVVDDSSTIRKVVCGILERHGYEAVAAAGAQIGLDAFAAESGGFDLVLVDFVMPKMNGLQFCRELRKSEAGLGLPVVLMSAKSDKIRDKFVLQTGAVDAITKPFDAQALVTVIEHALDRARDGRLPEAPPTERFSEHPSYPPPSVEPVSAAVLSGKLDGIPIGAVLQLVQLETLSGTLVVTSAASEIRIVMNRGKIDRASSRGARDEFRLGRFFVEEGLITPEEIDALLSSSLAKPPEDRPRLGDVLLKAGKVTTEQLAAALTRQSSELVYEVLRWQTGEFELLRADDLPKEPEPRLGLAVASVVMEGFRRVDEWRLIERKLGDFDEVLVPDPVALTALGEKDMTKQEKAVLAAIGKERTLRDVVAASHMSSFDACKIVCQFLEARLVRRRAAA